MAVEEEDKYRNEYAKKPRTVHREKNEQVIGVIEQNGEPW